LLSSQNEEAVVAEAITINPKPIDWRELRKFPIFFEIRDGWTWTPPPTIWKINWFTNTRVEKRLSNPSVHARQKALHQTFLKYWRVETIPCWHSNPKSMSLRSAGQPVCLWRDPSSQPKSVFTLSLYQQCVPPQTIGEQDPQ
jgi:hypothetical protein